MSMRKLSLMMVLALAVSASAFAAEEPPVVPMSQDEFLATLQDQPAEGAEELPELEGVETPVLKHGTCDFYDYVCRGCTLSNGARGLRFCKADKCNYNGTIHYHYYDCGACTTICAI